VLNRGSTAGTIATIMTRNLDDISICFLPSRDRPNPDFRYQLHRYLRLGVNLVQVKNQLR